MQNEGAHTKNKKGEDERVESVQKYTFLLSMLIAILCKAILS